MVKKRKYVTWRSLKKGQKIYGYKKGSMWSGFRAEVESANVAFVTILKWGTDREQISSEDTTFEVDMTQEEFEAMYAKQATEVMKALKNHLSEYEIGYHEMWNAWITYDPYMMAAECQDKKMKVVGVCEEIFPKRNMFDPDLVLDIGICAEYEDGDRIWCHASKEYLKDMIEEYGHLVKEDHSDGG